MKRTVCVAAVLVAVATTFSGCAVFEWFGWSAPPSELIVGNWLFDLERTDMTDYNSSEPHPDLPFYRMRILADEYFIEDTNGAVVDHSEFTTIDDQSFHTLCVARTDHPEYVGYGTYSQYAIERTRFTFRKRTMTITYYNDESFTDHFWTAYLYSE